MTIINECFARYRFCNDRTWLSLCSAAQSKDSGFENNQKRLRAHYGVNKDTLILDYGPELKELIQIASERFPQAKYADLWFYR